MINKLKIGLFLIVFSLVGSTIALGQENDLLSKEENFFLNSRNRTIIVYLEKSNPPFSYTSAGGNIQGMGIDYLELIAEKIDVKIQYLSPQSRSQIASELPTGKGDVSLLMETMDRAGQFIFTDSYVTVPSVIVTRKDFNQKGALNLSDFNGKRVAVTAGSALKDFVRQNYPRVVIEDMTDDEISLQQVVLGEVDAAVLDVASLSFYLSKQVLSSVKIVGNVGFDYNPSFALRASEGMLQAILEKGMSQISATDRDLLSAKWVVVPGAEVSRGLLDSLAEDNLKFKIAIPVLGGFMFAMLFLFFRHRGHDFVHHFKPHEDVQGLKEEVLELEKMNDALSKDLRLIKEEEDKIQAKIESLGK